jgi:hypothetical protein
VVATLYIYGLDFMDTLANSIKLVEPLVDVVNSGGMVYILARFGGIQSNLEYWG